VKRSVWVAVAATVAVLLVPGLIRLARLISWHDLTPGPAFTQAVPIWLGWAGLAGVGVGLAIVGLRRRQERMVRLMARRGYGISAIARRTHLAHDAIRTLLDLTPGTSLQTRPEDPSDRQEALPPAGLRLLRGFRRQQPSS